MKPDARVPTPRASENGSRNLPSDASASEAKDAVRARIRAGRRQDASRDARDAARLPLLLGLAERHPVVACYLSVPPEPSTRALVEALDAAGSRVLLPTLAGRRTPDWAWYARGDDLVEGWHRIPEPPGTGLGASALRLASLVIAPALAVTPRGERLGTGGGWYDRALGHAAPGAVVAAVVNDTEVLDAIPTEPWDLRVGVVVTESGVWPATGE